YRCEWPGCAKRFTTKQNKNRHMDIHATINKYRCSRPGCGQEFCDITDFKHHLELHRHPDNYRCLWPGCYRQLSCNTALKTHMSEHTGSRRYRCHWPGYEAEDSESADGIDCDVSHESDDEISDENNDGMNERQDSRGSHKKLNETNAKKRQLKGTGGQYDCDWEGCGKRFKTIARLKQHTKLHSGVAYRCDIPGCLSNFPCLAYLQKHKNRVNHQKFYESMAEKKIISGSVDENDDKNTNDSQRASELKAKPKYRSIDRKNEELSERQDSRGSHKTFNETNAKKKRLKGTGGKNACDWDGCGKRFARLDHLQRHKHLHSSVTYRCDIGTCTKEFATPVYLKSHKACHRADRPKSEGRYVCDYLGCGKKFSSRSGLKGHEPIHSGVTYRCPVEGCGATLQSQSYLKAHHNKRHTTRRQYRCEVDGCQHVFRVKESLTHHRLAQHPESMPDSPWFVCQWPGCQFRTKCRRYIRLHGPKHTKPYRCDECGASFSQNPTLVRHRRVHDKSAQYRCHWPGCEKLFADTNGLAMHTNTHTGAQVYPCLWPGCDKTFVWRAALNYHTKCHKGGQLGSYRCYWTGCAYRSTNASNFKSHVYRHKGLKGMPTDDYLCSYSDCGFTSQKSSEVIKHVKESHNN
ncbi:unnamed protein product, partial [Oppiella nova]